MTKRALTAAFLALALVATAAPALAQQSQQPPQPPQLVRPQELLRRQLSDSERAVLDSQNAWNTQQDLWRVMRQYPPAVGEIIQRDPSLLIRPDYMSAYPALAGYIEQHPEIARN